MKVTLFYDHDHPLYSSVSALLNEYRDVNATPPCGRRGLPARRRGGGENQGRVQNHLAGVTNKNLIIFDCDGRVKVVNGNALAEYVLEQVPNETEREFRRKPVAFLGEKMFSSALLSVISPKPLKAYDLTNHGEHRLDGTDEAGYLTFNSVLEQNYIKVETLSLLGTNTVPGDCNLLIIAGPTAPLGDAEREKIDDYLHQGGRLFALLNFASLARPTGLEKILAGWGVEAGDTHAHRPEKHNRPFRCHRAGFQRSSHCQSAHRFPVASGFAAGDEPVERGQPARRRAARRGTCLHQSGGDGG